MEREGFTFDVLFSAWKLLEPKFELFDFALWEKGSHHHHHHLISTREKEEDKKTSLPRINEVKISL